MSGIWGCLFGGEEQNKDAWDSYINYFGRSGMNDKESVDGMIEEENLHPEMKKAMESYGKNIGEEEVKSKRKEFDPRSPGRPSGIEATEAVLKAKYSAPVQLQLEAARYAYHAIRKSWLKGLVRGQTITEAQGEEAYLEAMRNYDGIIANAVSGNSREANNAEMEKGWND